MKLWAKLRMRTVKFSSRNLVKIEANFSSGYRLCSSIIIHQGFRCLETSSCPSSSTELLSCEGRRFHRWNQSGNDQRSRWSMGYSRSFGTSNIISWRWWSNREIDRCSVKISMSLFFFKLLKKKIDYVLNKTDLNVIACIGETLEERESGKTNEVVERQVKAYQGRFIPCFWRFAMTIFLFSFRQDWSWSIRSSGHCLWTCVGHWHRQSSHTSTGPRCSCSSSTIHWKKYQRRHRGQSSHYLWWIG